ncbi:MAG: long-chain fatty acid--CoA ligase [Bacillota bacterium]
MNRPWVKYYDSGVPTTIDYPRIPLYGLLERSAAKFPKRVAINFLGGLITYEQLNRMADAFAAALVNMGVKKGDRVCIYLPNCPQFPIAYFGALKAGAVVVPTNPLYVERELQHQVCNSGAETIITLTLFYPRVRNIKTQTPLKNVIVTNIKEYFPPVLKALFTLAKEKKEGHRVKVEPGVYEFSRLMREFDGRPYDKPAVDPDDVACLLYTGGTTGVPKGAVLRHSNLLSNAIATRHWLNDIKEGEEVVLSVLPFFHSYGMTTCLNMGTYIAATLVLLPKFELGQLLSTINKTKPTLFPGVPTIYVAINNAPDISKYNLKSIRACISGAAGLPVEVQARFEAITGGRLVEGYGLSEASPVTHCNPIYGLRKPGSIGIPFPDTEARIVDLESGKEVKPAGEIGELVVRGPQVMKGYWQMPDETEAVLRDGWLYTGDIAKCDEDGYFYIVDRKKDMIIAGGFNIYPREIEEVLYTHPKVKEAVAVGIHDEYRGETVKAYVVLKEGEASTPEEIIQFCRERLAKYKVPREIEFRNELPKTMVGKILRRILAEEEAKKRQKSTG